MLMSATLLVLLFAFTIPSQACHVLNTTWTCDGHEMDGCYVLCDGFVDCLVDKNDEDPGLCELFNKKLAEKKEQDRLERPQEEEEEEQEEEPDCDSTVSTVGHYATVVTVSLVTSCVVLFLGMFLFRRKMMKWRLDNHHGNDNEAVAELKTMIV